MEIIEVFFSETTRDLSYCYTFFSFCKFFFRMGWLMKYRSYWKFLLASNSYNSILDIHLSVCLSVCLSLSLSLSLSHTHTPLFLLINLFHSGHIYLILFVPLSLSLSLSLSFLPLFLLINLFHSGHIYLILFVPLSLSLCRSCRMRWLHPCKGVRLRQRVSWVWLNHLMMRL